MPTSLLRDQIRELVAHHSLGVLATHSKGYPHTSLVAVLMAGDLAYLYFATPRTTRKFQNLQEDERVAIFFDNRSLPRKGDEEVVALTAYGFAKEVDAEVRPALERAYESAHPDQGFFVRSPDSALFQVEVERWSLVTRFQEVQEFRPHTDPSGR